MKVAILAGGYGSRLSEETTVRPKPMVEIGGRPILWHIMKYYASYGNTHFIIALGYKGEAIKHYMVNYLSLEHDLTIRMKDGRVTMREGPRLDWTVDLIDTGLDTQTGGRIKRLAPHIGEERFMLAYGDGLSNIDLTRLLDFHKEHGRLATITAVRPPARFGYMVFEGDKVARFTEKPHIGEGWINGAFFVLEPGIFDYIEGDSTVWEREPLERLAEDGELMAYKHTSFWQCMDTLREKFLLESLWQSNQAPWKVWED